MFRKSNSRRILENQKSLNREWLFHPGTDEMREDDLRHIERNLENDAPGARLNLADSLSRLGMWYAIAGQIAVLDGSVDGWTEIHRSWLYESSSLRVRISVFQQGQMMRGILAHYRHVQSLAFEANPSALCLAYALLFRWEFEIEFFGDALRAMLTGKDVVRESFWDYHPLVPFFAQLLALRKRQVLDELKSWDHPLGPYQSIIDAWTEPSALKKAIYEACEFHCQRIEDNCDDYRPEFGRAPFDLVPAEILAIYSVRQELGLETPHVEHPLLEPPFNAPLGRPSDVSDELLERIEILL